MRVIHGMIDIYIIRDMIFETFGVFCHDGVYFSLEFRIRAVYAYNLLKQEIIDLPSTPNTQRELLQKKTL